jgi:sugar-specific transcriptional regulator TrmB
MSHKSLTADLCRAARRARGKQADDTRRGREQALACFAQFLWNAGYQIHTVGQIKEKHFRAWIDDLIARGRSKRTIANNSTHIRTALEGIGRRSFGRSPRLDRERAADLILETAVEH